MDINTVHICICRETYLLAPVDHIFGIRKASHRRATNHRMMTWRSVGHFHGIKLQERFAQGHATQQQLPAIKNYDKMD